MQIVNYCDPNPDWVLGGYNQKNIYYYRPFNRESHLSLEAPDSRQCEGPHETFFDSPIYIVSESRYNFEFADTTYFTFALPANYTTYVNAGYGCRQLIDCIGITNDYVTFDIRHRKFLQLDDAYWSTHIDDIPTLINSGKTVKVPVPSSLFQEISRGCDKATIRIRLRSLDYLYKC